MLGWCLSLTRLKSQNVTDYRSSLRTETSEIIRNHQNSSMEKIGIAGIACSAAGHDRQRWCRMEGIHPESLIWMNWQVNLKSLSGFFWELRTQKGFSKRMKILEIFGVALEPSMVSRHGRLLPRWQTCWVWEGPAAFGKGMERSWKARNNKLISNEQSLRPVHVWSTCRIASICIFRAFSGLQSADSWWVRINESMTPGHRGNA